MHVSSNVPDENREHNLLTAREDAERLCISGQSRSQDSVRIGRCVRYAPSDLQAFIESQTGGGE